jgi:hypothetical protein
MALVLSLSPLAIADDKTRPTKEWVPFLGRQEIGIALIFRLKGYTLTSTGVGKAFIGQLKPKQVVSGCHGCD